MVKKSFINMRSIINNNKINPYNIAKNVINDIHMPCIILVEPFSDANIGSISRVMLNFCITDLRIINPKCNHLSDIAKQLAVGSIDILENAKIYSDLQSSIIDLSKVMATTARTRDMTHIIYNPTQASYEAVLKINNNINNDIKKVGIVFGRERSGLNNYELSLADSIINIPTFDEYPVINLAQSVNIIGYELFKRKLLLEEEENDNNNDNDNNNNLYNRIEEELQKNDVKIRFRRGHEKVSREDIDSFLLRLENELYLRNYEGISKNNNHNIIENNEIKKRELNFNAVKNLFLRISGLISNADLKVIQGVLSALIRNKKL